ncbi:MAG: methyltransferase family protein [Vicinamibacterales bacterium]
MRTRSQAVIGAFLFFWVAPAMVAGLIPYQLSGWRLQPPFLGTSATRVAGAALIAAGGAALLECFARFAIKGRGTPAPIAPTETLVVTGLYRFVRNPMYVAVVLVILGQALLLGSTRLLAYALAVWTAFHIFVLAYEEPTLRRQFGESYDRYRTNVRRWLPRLMPWTPLGA